MKRIGNIFEDIISLENLWQADENARKGKRSSYGVKKHDKRRKENLMKLHKLLKEECWENSEYKTFKIFEPKERLIFQLPYFPDRIVHHAIMNKLQKMFEQNFTADTYSCIKGRGIHTCARKLEKVLKNNPNETKFCLKMDVKKFYPSIDHKILKTLLRKKIKDEKLLNLIGKIIDSSPGLPIGNYLSQYFANFYLSYFDHWLKEEKRVKYYFRYADDLVILSDNKPYLHQLRVEISQYLKEKLNLKVKGNYQVFPVAPQGIDFVGYVFRHTHTLLRKKIKQNFGRAVRKNNSKSSIQSYKGWAMHCNSKNLLKKLNV